MNYKNLLIILISCACTYTSCKKDNGEPAIEAEVIVPENPASFKEVASVTLGTAGAAEISAYDPMTKKLFVVNNAMGSKVDVVDISALPTATKVKTLDFSTTSGVANSVAVSNGMLAVP